MTDPRQAEREQQAGAMSLVWWLIERGSPAEFWAGNDRPEAEWWTPDIHQVQPMLRFPTQEGAQAEANKLEDMGVQGPLRVCDHQFISPDDMERRA